MRIEFEFKTGFSRKTVDIDNDISFEDLVTRIWDAGFVLVGDLSFRVDDLLWIEEQKA